MILLAVCCSTLFLQLGDFIDLPSVAKATTPVFVLRLYAPKRVEKVQTTSDN